jgi:hypothetical protein
METLFARTSFQAFLFAGAVITGLFAKFRPENEVLMIKTILVITILAIAAFVLKLVLDYLKPESRENAIKDALLLKAEAWPDEKQIKVARGFMVLGLVIYLGYHFLDGVVILDENASLRVARILDVRMCVSAVIAGFWVLSFTNWFRNHYVRVVTFAILIAGAGIGLMLYYAGPQVHFYYQGFIQVIAFAAFAFRLPPRPLAWICAFMMCLFVIISGFQIWDGEKFDLSDKQQQAVLANNLVSLVTFVTLALIASAALRAGVSSRASTR